MSRDYARKERSTRKSATPNKSHSRSARPRVRGQRTASARSQRGGLSVKWILSLAAVGGFVGFIVYLNSLPTNPGPKPSAEVRQPPESVPETAEQQEDNKKQNFRFYEMLPESEVVPPSVEEYNPSPTKQDFSYLVQSGSFRTREDAERQRAQIAFQGLRARVQRVELESGSTWYRVNVGPFTSRSQMNSAIDKLVSLNIQPLIRKIPKKG